MNGSKEQKNIERTGLLSASLVSTDMLDYFGLNSEVNGQKNGIDYNYQEGHAVCMFRHWIKAGGCMNAVW
jgi:hypothetical protein